MIARMLEIRPFAGALGAEIGGVRLARLDDEPAWKEIHAAFAALLGAGISRPGS
jgi:hypothetical protein